MVSPTFKSNKISTLTQMILTRTSFEGELNKTTELDLSQISEMVAHQLGSVSRIARN